jgi:hypothetical protein
MNDKGLKHCSDLMRQHAYEYYEDACSDLFDTLCKDYDWWECEEIIDKIKRQRQPTQAKKVKTPKNPVQEEPSTDEALILAL